MLSRMGDGFDRSRLVGAMLVGARPVALSLRFRMLERTISTDDSFDLAAIPSYTPRDRQRRGKRR